MALGRAQGSRSAADILRGPYDNIAADDPFWELAIGDPGTDRIFDNAVYERGAMTLQALRHRIGEDAFWLLLRTWLQQEAGGNAPRRTSRRWPPRSAGRTSTSFFTAWLRTPGKPARTADNGLVMTHQHHDRLVPQAGRRPPTAPSTPATTPSTGT